jgi:hypothetical protein
MGCLLTDSLQESTIADDRPANDAHNDLCDALSGAVSAEGPAEESPEKGDMHLARGPHP